MAEVMQPPMAVAPPQAAPQPQVEVISTSSNPNALADDAINRRDTTALTQIAKDNVGTPASDLAMRMVTTIKDSQNKFNELVNPIDKAGGAGTPAGNIKIAQAFQTVTDNPQYGTALLKYVLGDKEGAVKQITGGDIKTLITYDNNGNQIEEKVNALGEPVSYTDRKTGQQMTKDEYAQRVGGISSWANTLRGKTETETRAESTKVFVKEQQQANNWYQITQAHKPLLQENYNTLNQYKTDLPKDVYNKIIGSVSQSMGQASSKSNSKSALNQLNDAITNGQSIKVDNRIATALNSPKLAGMTLRVQGDRLVSEDNSLSLTAGQLKQMQESDTIGSEATKNAAATMASIAEAERLGQINSVVGAKLRRVIENSQTMGREMADGVDKYGKPSFISLPTSANFTDKQAQTIAQTLQGMQNADQLAEFIKFNNNAVEGHKSTNTVPLPGEIGTAFTRQPLSKDMRKFYADEIGKAMNDEYRARSQPSIEVRFPSADSANAPKKAVAPPSAKPSLADLKKQAGG
tara:strand:- start:1584 stop:3143 length:1560 start_codon:yes stop_codon:yes gene_type:complete